MRTKPFRYDHLVPVTSTGAIAYRCRVIDFLTQLKRTSPMSFRMTFFQTSKEVLLQVDKDGNWVASKVEHWMTEGFMGAPGAAYPAIDTPMVRLSQASVKVRRRGNFIILEYDDNVIRLYGLHRTPLMMSTPGLDL